MRNTIAQLRLAIHALLLTCPLLASANMPPIQVGIQEIGVPIAYVDKSTERAAGHMSDLIRLIFSKTPYQADIHLKPYQRIPLELNAGNLDVGLLYQINHRLVAADEQKFSCSDNPLINSQSYLYGLKLSKAAIPTVGSFVSLYDEKHKAEYLSSPYRRVGFTSAEQAIKAMLAGHIDYVVQSESMIKYWQQHTSKTIRRIAFVADASVHLCVSTTAFDQTGSQKLLSQLETAMTKLSIDDINTLESKYPSDLTDLIHLVPGFNAPVQHWPTTPPPDTDTTD